MAQVLDLRGQTVARDTPPLSPVLLDPTGMRARVLAYIGGTVALLFLLWLLGLALAGVGLIPPGALPLGQDVASPAPPPLRALPRVTQPGFAAPGVAARRAAPGARSNASAAGARTHARGVPVTGGGARPGAAGTPTATRHDSVGGKGRGSSGSTTGAGAAGTASGNARGGSTTSAPGQVRSQSAPGQVKSSGSSASSLTSSSSQQSTTTTPGKSGSAPAHGNLSTTGTSP